MAETDGIGPVLPPWPLRDQPPRVERRERGGQRRPRKSPPPPRRREEDDDGRPHVDEYA